MTLTSPLRLSLLGTLLSVSLGSHAAPAAPATFSIDATPRAGAHQRQQIDMQATLTMRMEAGPDATQEQRAKLSQLAERIAQQGNIKMSMQMQQTIKVGQPDADGWLPLSLVSGGKAARIEMGGQTIPLPTANAGDMSVTARFNPKDFSFDVQKVNGGSQAMTDLVNNSGKALLNDALKMQKALAQRTMKVGDSVDVPFNLALPMPLPEGAGNMQGQVHYTLVRVDKGVAYFDLSMALNLNVDTPLSQPLAAAAAASAASAASSAEPAASAAEPAAAAPRMFHMVMNGSGKGSGTLRLADHLPLSNHLDMDLKMTIDGPDNGRMLMDMTMAVKSTGESLAKPAGAAKKNS